MYTSSSHLSYINSRATWSCNHSNQTHTDSCNRSYFYENGKNILHKNKVWCTPIQHHHKPQSPKLSYSEINTSNTLTHNFSSHFEQHYSACEQLYNVFCDSGRSFLKSDKKKPWWCHNIKPASHNGVVWFERSGW